MTSALALEAMGDVHAHDAQPRHDDPGEPGLTAGDSGDRDADAERDDRECEARSVVTAAATRSPSLLGRARLDRPVDLVEERIDDRGLHLLPELAPRSHRGCDVFARDPRLCHRPSDTGAGARPQAGPPARRSAPCRRPGPDQAIAPMSRTAT